MFKFFTIKNNISLSLILLYCTLFSCSVHHKKTSIVYNQKNYKHSVTLESILDDSFFVNRIPDNSQYQFLFFLYLPEDKQSNELAQYQEYLKNILNKLDNKGVIYTYTSIVQTQKELKNYYFDVYYIKVKGKNTSNSKV